MEFPAQKQLNVKDLLESNDYGSFFSGPFIYTLDGQDFNEDQLKDFVGYISENKYILFPYGIILLLERAQIDWLQNIARPPLFRIVHCQEDSEQIISSLRYKREKKLKGKSDLIELLVHQTWHQVNNPLNQKILKELASWTTEKNILNRENKIYEELLGNLNGQ